MSASVIAPKFDRAQFLSGIFDPQEYAQAQSAPKGDPQRRHIVGTCIQHMIVKGLRDSTIERHAREQSSWVNSKSPHFYDLPPLHVAIIKGNRAAFDVLLRNGADPTQADHRGWSALHHAAALGESEMLGILIEKVGQTAASSLRTDLDGTYLDIQHIMNQQFPDPNEIVCQIDDGSGVKDCTAKEYKRVTGAQYCPFVFYESEDDLYQEWKQEKEPCTEQEYSLSDQQISQFEKNPPKLCIDTTHAHEPPGIELRVCERVKRGQILDLYGGKRDFLTEDRATFYWTNYVDGQDYGSLATRSNMGNGVVPILFDLKGVRKVYLVALDDLPAGAAVRWNYGSEFVFSTPDPMFELDPEGILTLCPPCETFEDFEDAFEQLGWTGKEYLIFNPLPILSLYARGRLSLEHIIKKYQKLCEEEGLSNKIMENPHLTLFVKALSELDAKLSPENQGILRGKILEWSRRYSMLKLFNAIHRFSTTSDFTQAIQEIEHYFEEKTS